MTDTENGNTEVTENIAENEQNGAAAVEDAGIRENQDSSEDTRDSGSAAENEESGRNLFSKNSDKDAHWYVVHTYSGYEKKVKANIEMALENRNMKDRILEIRVPTQTVIETKDNGQRREVEKKLFPGYVLVNMIMDDDTWYVVRNTRGVTGFVGPGSKPVPLTDEEMKPLGIHVENMAINFGVGDMVTVVAGPWRDTIGPISRMDMNKRTATIMVELFGRETPVDISFDQISLMR